MDREFSDFIQKVLDKTDIVSLISRYVKVDRKGSTYWACCPFHHETQPSFAITPEKQFFHCFGCKESGNAIGFLMKIENIEFIDALKMLAEQAGLEMPKPRSGSTYAPVDKKRIALLHDLMRDAARHYYDNLSDPRAEVFNNYLADRKIPKNMITRFGLGASLDFTEMIDYLTQKGYSFELIRAAGIGEEKDGRKYDVFGKRLIYPIIDSFNNVIAFGGRTLEKNPDFAKYRNSTQTEIFDKSKTLYAINLLKKRKAVKRIDYVIITEGYMDVIALHKAGFDTAVASMGTALTAKQAKQLKLYSDLVYISYDGDSAGQSATMRGLEILKETGLTVKVVRLPDGLDPDDVIKRDGAAGYQKLLDEAVPLTAYKIDVLAKKYDLSDPDRRAQFAIESAKTVAALDNPVEQEQYFSYISQKTGFSAEALKRQANFSAAADRQKPVYTEPPLPDKVDYDDSLAFFLSSLIKCEGYAGYGRNVRAAMPDMYSARLYDWCRKHHPFKPADVFAEFGEEDVALNALFNRNPIPGDGEKRFADVETELYRRVLKKELDMLNADKSPASEKRIIEITIELASLKKYHS